MDRDLLETGDLLGTGKSLAEELEKKLVKATGNTFETKEMDIKEIVEDLRKNDLGKEKDEDKSEDLQVEDLEINPERVESLKKTLEDLDKRLEEAMGKKLLENEGKKLDMRKVVEDLNRKDSKWFSNRETDLIEELKKNIEEDKKVEALATGVPIQGDFVKRANSLRDLTEEKIKVVEKLLEEKGLNKVEERNRVWKIFNDDLLLVKKEMGVDDETWKKLVHNETEIQVSAGADDRGTVGFVIYDRDKVLDVAKDITEKRIEIIESKKGIEEIFESINQKIFA